jgi:hypothetical protein
MSKMRIYFDPSNTIDCDLEQMIRTVIAQGAGNKRIACNTVGYLLNCFEQRKAELEQDTAKRVEHILTELQKHFCNPDNSDKDGINKKDAYIFLIFISSPPSQMEGFNKTVRDLLNRFKQREASLNSFVTKHVKHALTELQQYDRNPNTARINELDAYIFRAFANHHLN